MQHRLDRLDGGRQALERARQRVAQAALDPDFVASTAKGHDRLLSPCPAAAGRMDAPAPPAPPRFKHGAGDVGGLHLMKMNSSGGRGRLHPTCPEGNLIRT